MILENWINSLSICDTLWKTWFKIRHVVKSLTPNSLFQKVSTHNVNFWDSRKRKTSTFFRVKWVKTRLSEYTIHIFLEKLISYVFFFKYDVLRDAGVDKRRIENFFVQISTWRKSFFPKSDFRFVFFPGWRQKINSAVNVRNNLLDKKNVNMKAGYLWHTFRPTTNI